MLCIYIYYIAPTTETQNVHFSYQYHITSSLFISSFPIIWFYTHQMENERKEKKWTSEKISNIRGSGLLCRWMYYGAYKMNFSFLRLLWLFLIKRNLREFLRNDEIPIFVTLMKNFQQFFTQKKSTFVALFLLISWIWSWFLSSFIFTMCVGYIG